MTMYAQQNASPAFCGEASFAARKFAVLFVILGIALAVSVFVFPARISGLLLLALLVLLVLISYDPPAREAKRR